MKTLRASEPSDALQHGDLRARDRERSERLRRSLYALQRDSGHQFVEEVARSIELRDERIRELTAAICEMTGR